MKKKMLIFFGVLIVLFAALAFVANYQNEQETAGNPYGKEELHPATVDQLDNELYQNQILPDELEAMLASGEDATIYFYSPTCVYCQRTTPVLVPMAEELGVEIQKLNLLEFRGAGATFGIEGTPTLIRYENGEEVARLSGQQSEETWRNFLEENVLDGEAAG